MLAEIHSVDVDAVGLGDLGRREGYIERQLKRWWSQFEQSKTRELPVLDDVYDMLKERVPEQGAATIVHGDYRLDNTMLGDDGRVQAVLDWEICTLGDPLADVGLLMVYWAEPGDDARLAALVPHRAAGLPQSQGGRSTATPSDPGATSADLDFYVAFGYWKLACIIEGVYARYVGGAMGAGSTGFEHFGDQVVRLAETAAKAAGRRMTGRDALRAARARPPLDRSGAGRRPWRAGSTPGSGASTAMATLLASATTEPVATFDVDTLLDHRARRPIVRIVDGVNTGLRWPEIQLRGGHDADGHDLLLLVGPEPDHQWRAFTGRRRRAGHVVRRRLVVRARAPSPPPCPTPAPPGWRRRPRPPSWRSEVGFMPGALDVPAGVQAALERALRRARDARGRVCGPSVPHYAAAMPYPEASAVLLEGLTSTAGITVDTADLRRAAEISRAAPRRAHRQQRGARARSFGNWRRRSTRTSLRGRARRRGRTLPTRRKLRRLIVGASRQLVRTGQREHEVELPPHVLDALLDHHRAVAGLVGVELDLAAAARSAST